MLYIIVRTLLTKFTCSTEAHLCIQCTGGRRASLLEDFFLALGPLSGFPSDPFVRALHVAPPVLLLLLFLLLLVVAIFVVVPEESVGGHLDVSPVRMLHHRPLRPAIRSLLAFSTPHIKCSRRPSCQSHALHQVCGWSHHALILIRPDLPIILYGRAVGVGCRSVPNTQQLRPYEAVVIVLGVPGRV
jgi:hypothetical protein